MRHDIAESKPLQHDWSSWPHRQLAGLHIFCPSSHRHQHRHHNLSLRGLWVQSPQQQQLLQQQLQQLRRFSSGGSLGEIRETWEVRVDAKPRNDPTKSAPSIEEMHRRLIEPRSKRSHGSWLPPVSFLSPLSLLSPSCLPPDNFARISRPANRTGRYALATTRASGPSWQRAKTSPSSPAAFRRPCGKHLENQLSVTYRIPCQVCRKKTVLPRLCCATFCAGAPALSEGPALVRTTSSHEPWTWGPSLCHFGGSGNRLRLPGGEASGRRLSGHRCGGRSDNTWYILV